MNSARLISALWILGLVLLGCENPAEGEHTSGGVANPSSPTPVAETPDDPENPATLPDPVPLDPAFDYTVSTNLGTGLLRSVVVPRGNGAGAFSLTLTQTPTNPDLNIEEINTGFAFVRADGSVVGATYQGNQVTEQVFGNTHAARSVSFSLARLAVGGSDLYHLATWQGYVKLRVAVAVLYFQPGPGTPPSSYTKTVEFPLVQDMPAVDGLGYLASFTVDTSPGVQGIPDLKAPQEWQYAAVVTYAGGETVSVSPSLTDTSPSPYALFLSVPGLRPTSGPVERWQVTLDVTGDGDPDLTWDIPEGFDTQFPDFNCVLDAQTGQPVVEH